MQLHDRRVVASLRFLHDLREPTEEGGNQPSNAKSEHKVRARHVMHEQNHPAGENQCRKRTGEGPDVGWKNVIIVVLCAGHDQSCCWVVERLRTSARFGLGFQEALSAAT